MQTRVHQLVSIGAVAAGVIVGAGLRPAAAQDAEVRVRVGIPPAVAEEVRQAVQSVHDEAAQDIRAAVRTVLTEVRAAMATVQSRDFRVEQTARETRTLALGPGGSLDLRNFTGDITVQAAEGRTVTIEITRTARGRTEADAKRGLEETRVEISERGDRATVQARHDNTRRPPYSVAVAYRVTAPPGTNVRVNSMSGDVTVRGIRGDLTVEVMSSDIDITGAGRVSEATSLSGDIRVSGADSDHDLRVSSMSGTIRLEDIRSRRLVVSGVSSDIVADRISAGGATVTTMSGDVRYGGPLVARGRYEFQSHSGTLRIAASGPAGFDIQASTFSGALQPDKALELRNLTVTRRSLRGTAGDGGALITATTFSGDVIITRR